eukprot:Amastigsp_a175476_23.p5 type:complete len:141 gc:universal Amastigsp_a175476_23:1359-937(-)
MALPTRSAVVSAPLDFFRSLSVGMTASSGTMTVNALTTGRGNIDRGFAASALSCNEPTGSGRSPNSSSSSRPSPSSKSSSLPKPPSPWATPAGWLELELFVRLSTIVEYCDLTLYIARFHRSSSRHASDLHASRSGRKSA